MVPETSTPQEICVCNPLLQGQHEYKPSGFHMKLNFQMKDEKLSGAAAETKQPMVRSSEMLVIKCAHTQLSIAQNARTK